VVFVVAIEHRLVVYFTVTEVFVIVVAIDLLFVGLVVEGQHQCWVSFGVVEVAWLLRWMAF
jgi:hypothetical protein